MIICARTESELYREHHDDGCRKDDPVKLAFVITAGFFDEYPAADKGDHTELARFLRGSGKAAT